MRKHGPGHEGHYYLERTLKDNHIKYDLIWDGAWGKAPNGKWYCLRHKKGDIKTVTLIIQDTEYHNISVSRAIYLLTHD